MLTFDPHPLAVLKPEAQPKLLQSFPIKRDLIAGLGVEELVVIPFDREFARALRAASSSRTCWSGRLDATHVSVGENFRFGHEAEGDPELLAGRDEFETRVVPLVEVAGETVSSSHIRGLVAAGEVGKATEFLGGPFLIRGRGRARRRARPRAGLPHREPRA